MLLRALQRTFRRPLSRLAHELGAPVELSLLNDETSVFFEKRPLAGLQEALKVEDDRLIVVPLGRPTQYDLLKTDLESFHKQLAHMNSEIGDLKTANKGLNSEIDALSLAIIGLKTGPLVLKVCETARFMEKMLIKWHFPAAYAVLMWVIRGNVKNDETGAFKKFLGLPMVTRLLEVIDSKGFQEALSTRNMVAHEPFDEAGEMEVVFEFLNDPRKTSEFLKTPMDLSFMQKPWYHELCAIYKEFRLLNELAESDD